MKEFRNKRPTRKMWCGQLLGTALLNVSLDSVILLINVTSMAMMLLLHKANVQKSSQIHHNVERGHCSLNFQQIPQRHHRCPRQSLGNCSPQEHRTLTGGLAKRKWRTTRTSCSFFSCVWPTVTISGHSPQIRRSSLIRCGNGRHRPKTELTHRKGLSKID